MEEGKFVYDRKRGGLAVFKKMIFSAVALLVLIILACWVGWHIIGMIL